MSDLTAPFPYYGGKRRFAPLIWERFGPVDLYVEPFAGSRAVLLANPYPIPQREIACDTDGMLCNFWRALTLAPEEVAHWADYPTIHQDLTARHKWLKEWRTVHAPRLMEDAEYFDVQVGRLVGVGHIVLDRRRVVFGR